MRTSHIYTTSLSFLLRTPAFKVETKLYKMGCVYGVSFKYFMAVRPTPEIH